MLHRRTKQHRKAIVSSPELSEEDGEDELEATPVPVKSRLRPRKTEKSRNDFPLDRPSRARMRVLFRRGYNKSSICRTLAHSHLTVTKTLDIQESDDDYDYVDRSFLKKYPVKKLESQRLVKFCLWIRENPPFPRLPISRLSKRAKPDTPSPSSLPTPQKPGQSQMPQSLRRNLILRSPDEIICETPQDAHAGPSSASEGRQWKAIGTRFSNKLHCLLSADQTPQVKASALDFGPEITMPAAADLDPSEMVGLVVPATQNPSSQPPTDLQAMNQESLGVVEEDDEDEIEYTGCHLKGVPDNVKIMSPSGREYVLD